MSTSYKEILGKIDTLIFDVDGVFTDSSLYLLPGHPPVRKMNVKDGYAVQLAVKLGYHVAIITGGTSPEVKTRFEGLGVKHVYLASKNKVKVLDTFLKENGLSANKALYMGDDIPDYHVIQKVALGCCPKDAAPSIREVSRYISPKNGGEGCVRDVIEQLLRLNGQWLAKGSEEW